jgi:hypothetical protein
MIWWRMLVVFVPACAAASLAGWWVAAVLPLEIGYITSTVLALLIAGVTFQWWSPD